MRRALERRGVALLFACTVVSYAAFARADQASGTFTGTVELRGSYYWETSTRVVAPEVRFRLYSPSGVNIDGRYVYMQEDTLFTEVRNQGSLGLSREFDLGDAQLLLGARGWVSHEPDYLGTWTMAFAALSLNQRNTVLSSALTYAHDNVGAVLRGGDPRFDSDRGRQGQFEAFAAVLSWYQIISPVMSIATSYQLVHAWGFLENAYRRPIVNGIPQPETHPDLRTRHTLVGRLAFYIPETETAVHLGYRAYLDDWHLGALTPEVRIYQMIGPSVLVRARYRYYRQTEAFFYDTEYGDGETYFTADPKMAGFQSHLLGIQLRVGLSFLERTPLSFLERAWLDASFNYWFQTSSFGDAVLTQLGVRVPF